VAVEARSARPMLPLVLFRDLRFSVTNAASFALGFSSYASIFLYSLFLQQVQGWSPTETGLRMAPLFLTQIVVAPFTGRLTGRFGHAPVMIAGYLFIGLSMLMLSGVDATTPFVLFGALLAAAGVGNGLAIPSTSAAAMASTPRSARASPRPSSTPPARAARQSASPCSVLS
jgi:MFS family permease